MSLMDGMSPERREQLVSDAMTAVEQLDSGEWSAADVTELVGADDLVTGLVLYANLLEALMMIGRDVSVDDVRAAARSTIGMWRASGSEAAS